VGAAPELADALELVPEDDALALALALAFGAGASALAPTPLDITEPLVLRRFTADMGTIDGASFVGVCSGFEGVELAPFGGPALDALATGGAAADGAERGAGKAPTFGTAGVDAWLVDMLPLAFRTYR
jgi:hypothetical protein